MLNSKKYIHDHVVLLLASINAFLAISGIIYIFIRLANSNHASGFIIQYRPNLGPVSFKTGNLEQIISFTVYAALILIINITLSYRSYKVHRQLSIMVLSLGVLLLTLNVIISNALLQLR